MSEGRLTQPRVVEVCDGFVLSEPTSPWRLLRVEYGVFPTRGEAELVARTEAIQMDPTALLNEIRQP